MLLDPIKIIAAEEVCKNTLYMSYKVFPCLFLAMLLRRVNKQNFKVEFKKIYFFNRVILL